MNRFMGLIALSILMFTSVAWGHGSSLAVFKLVEETPGEFHVLWKVNRPAASASLDDITLSKDCAWVGKQKRLVQEGTTRTRSTLRCQSELGPGSLVFPAEPPGLHVMIEASFADGSRYTKLLKDEREVEITPAAIDGPVVTAGRYAMIGVEHILLGIDHLLFVLGLLLLIASSRKLIWAITAFTIAHSITLALAVLGVLSLRPEPVEACIALSIVVLAREVLVDSDSLSKRLPWLVAFGFGLLHGLGFAGALSQVGLPQDQLPVALVGFNVGVEAGQLLFVLVVWQCRKLVSGKNVAMARSLRTCTAYGMGAVAVYWVIERVGWVVLFS